MRQYTNSNSERFRLRDRHAIQDARRAWSAGGKSLKLMRELTEQVLHHWSGLTLFSPKDLALLINVISKAPKDDGVSAASMILVVRAVTLQQEEAGSDVWSSLDLSMIVASLGRW